MKNALSIIAIVLIVMGVLNVIFAGIMAGVATKNPEKLTTDIQVSRIDDLAHDTNYQKKASKVYQIYLIVSICVIVLGVFAFFYLKNLTVTQPKHVAVRLGDSFFTPSKGIKDKKPAD